MSCTIIHVPIRSEHVRLKPTSAKTHRTYGTCAHVYLLLAICLLRPLWVWAMRVVLQDSGPLIYYVERIYYSISHAVISHKTKTSKVPLALPSPKTRITLPTKNECHN